MNIAKLDRLARTCASRSDISNLSLAVCQPSAQTFWDFGAPDQPYFIASVTKLFTSAMIMQLCDEGSISLDTRASDIVGRETMSGLNVQNGLDSGPTITISELLGHTSGVPDYFEQGPASAPTVLSAMLNSDRGWTTAELLAIARSMPGQFAPSTPTRAHYSDTNYLLLGLIIEKITGFSYERALETRILTPLNLAQTYLFTEATAERYRAVVPVFHGKAAVHAPRALASFTAEGGIVSTTRDQIRFMQAFVTGELFLPARLAQMTSHWRSVFSPMVPLSYGLGIMRFHIPRWQSPFFAVPSMIGHSGAFGSFLFYVPERDLYVAGTVNQMVPRRLPYPLLVRIVLAAAQRP